MDDNKLFFKVFDGFTATDKIADFYKNVFVERAVLKRSQRALTVYIVSQSIIPKWAVFKMEEELKERFFKAQRISVIIYERFVLTDIYNEQAIVDAYKDSMLLELRETSMIDYQLVEDSEWFVNDNIVTLTMNDDFLSKGRSVNIKDYIEGVFKTRFAKEIKVGFDYTEEQKQALRDAKEYKLKLETSKTMDELSKAVAEENANNEVSVNENGEISVEKKDKKLTKNQQMVADTEAKVVEAAKNRSEQGNEGNGNGYRNNGYGQKRSFSKRGISVDPEVFFGKNVEGTLADICDIQAGIGECVIKGMIRTMDEHTTKTGKVIMEFTLTDFTDTIMCKIFVSPEDSVAIKSDLFVGGFYKIKGIPEYDDFAHDVTFGRIDGIKKISDFRSKRSDDSFEKRVELHMHTGYSDMDSVVDVGEIIKRAKSWGHKAIAITDHGVCQAFPVANHCVKPGDPFKIIYGLEGYFVDDLNDLVTKPMGQTFDDSYVVFDIETTGFKPRFNKIIEIGAVKISGGEIVDRFSTFINPERPIPYNITKLTSITDTMVANADTVDIVLPKFLEFCKGSVLVAHNAKFDTGFIKYNCKELDLPYDFTVCDTMTMAQVLVHNLGKYTLDRLCKFFAVDPGFHHRAVDDAEATAHIFLKLLDILKNQEIFDLDGLNKMGNASPEKIKKARMYHGIILAKNDTGRYNLYRLVSESHINYFNTTRKRPVIPKSLINKYREGLILGSACEAGELFQALLNGAADEEVSRIVDFYDYLEIQPVGNNAFMIKSDKYSDIKSEDDIREINKEIIRLADDSGKMCVATCDVHFIDPEDEIYRKIIMTGNGFKQKEVDEQSPLYFRTTEEMLQEFDYLGAKKAKEVVIDNTNAIADMIEYTSPVRPDKCPPVIENSDEELRRICYDKAHEIYGPNLPEIVENRLEKELNSIISNGFAVLYIIAQKLVWKSNADGYMVGSRGSVGSSFVACMAGITEVNSLHAHYICPECHYVDFDSEYVKNHASNGNSGCDMEDKNCPNCGHKLIKEGHDIPFETFLGFNGDKEPDIDLNFSSEDQPHAHAYTEELFGKGHAFRAGTIGTVAEKTAYGFTLKYLEQREITKRRCEVERLSAGCLFTKRTTGQHPGGMIVLPRNEEIYPFTPIQHPANDVDCGIITTHFEYHSIDHNLLKLDILGHADPTMIRRLEDLTGVDAKTIPLDDKKVMALFHNTESLGITPDDIGGTKLGCLGVPEFGTDFAMQMLIDTNPKNFSDLARIAGLAHGTDVWLGNAETLIKEGKTELSGAICCRDDIMVYLINKGLEANMAFKIMEAVRKGMVAKGKCDKWPEWRAEMEKHDVPDWYIWSCEKIKYMFPKAHAVAYVMMAWRVAWFKVYHPLAYYTAFFSIRAKAFNYEKMCLGPEIAAEEIKKIREMEKPAAVDLDTLRDLRIVQEMYARGIEFMPIDIYRADAERFLIIDGKIMPALSTVEGLGGKAAEQLMAAAKEGEFYCKEELNTRAKLGNTTIKKLDELGLLGDMQDTPQYDFFALLNGQ